MLKKLNSLRNREDGFTLIELLIVVIIIGILAAIALPIFLNQQKAARDGAVVSDVRNTVDNVATWQVQNQNTAEATTSAYTTAGGKVVQSTGDTVYVKVNSDGSYIVDGFRSNQDGAQYNGTAGTGSGQNVYEYSSTNGTFGKVAVTTTTNAVA